MARLAEPNFTGGVSDDLTTLATLFREEVQVAAGRSEPFFDAFSLGVNDGISMMVTRPWLPRSGQDEVRVGEFTLEGLGVAHEMIEVKYWSLDAAGIGNFPMGKLAELDRELAALYEEAGTPDGLGSVDSGIHLRFEGDASRPRWSLFIQNETLRKLNCAVEGDIATYELFSDQGPAGASPQVVFLGNVSPLCPLGVVVPRGVLQLRAQCLDADVIIFPRRGMAVQASSPADLWERYCTVMDRLEEDVRVRLRKLPWAFQGTGEMLSESLIEPARNAVCGCVGSAGTVRFWESSREGVLRKVLCSSELLERIKDGFPDHRTAVLGGMVPLLVSLDAGESAKGIEQHVREAWEGFVTRYSTETPLRFDEESFLPAVVVLSGLGILTTVDDAAEAQAAYSALAEVLTVVEGARAYGGLGPLPYEEAVGLANCPLRRPSAVEAVGGGMAPLASSEPEEKEDAGDKDAEGNQDTGGNQDTDGKATVKVLLKATLGKDDADDSKSGNDSDAGDTSIRLTPP